MSSDSDGFDEFYDAEDVTPGRVSRSGSRISEDVKSATLSSIESGDLGSENLSLQESDEFADEERFLEQLKHEAEERRKKEDAEIQRKIQSLERRKQNQERKRADLEKRKRKLQKLRQLVTEDNTAKRPLELVSRDDDVIEARDAEDGDSDAASVGSDNSVNSNRSNNSSQNAAGGSGTGASASASIVAQTSLATHKTNSLPERLVVDLESVDRTLAESCTDDNELLDCEFPLPEPDIVQSSKPRPQSLPELPTIQIDPPQPKAPPRRKKKKLSDDEEGACGGQLPLDGEGEGEPNIHSPTSTVLNLTKEFECALDLEGATCGSRHVQSRDDASTKAETGDESSQSGSMNLTTGEENRMRPRSNSGSRFLTDQEILEAVSILNLDTGEKIPLSLAEEKLPQGVNPLTLHIMRRTKEYSSDSSLHKAYHSDDDEGMQSGDGGQTLSRQAHKMKQRGLRLTKIVGKKMGKTMTKIKHAAEEALNQESESEDEWIDGKKLVKVKAARGHTGPFDFTNLKPVQDLTAATQGAVWTMKFSHCGRLLATGGQDNVLRVWVLKEALTYFDEMRQKYSDSVTKLASAYSQDSLNSDAASDFGDFTLVGAEEDDDKRAPFVRKPFCAYRGHTADLLDVSWSKNYFILSSSMDKTVRLWHTSRRECLCCFQHIDFVTAIAFHPKDDRYFLSGSLDGKLRLWNIPDKKVALWNEVSGQTKLITAANFCQNGKFAVVGTYDGRCILYSTEQLKYYAQIFVRSTRGKNARGRKVTGVEALPNEDKILVSSNDSRLRLYDLRDLTLTCKYKGCTNNSSQIKASFSSNGRYIICGSEDHTIYIWRTYHENPKFTSVRRDRNSFWEAVRAHNAVVTAACFAPNPSLIIRNKSQPDTKSRDTPRDAEAKPRDPEVKPRDYLGEVFVSADFTGVIKVFKNRFRPVSEEKR